MNFFKKIWFLFLIIFSCSEPIERTTTTIYNSNLSIPANVIATDGDYTDRVRISWSSVTNATSYKIYRADNSNGPYSLIGNSTTTTYDDTTLSTSNIDTNGRYYYKIAASNSYGDSALSNYDGGNVKWKIPVNLNRTDFPYTQEVILQGFYWYIPDHNKSNANSESNLYQLYTAKANDFLNDGITAIWFPPSGKAFNDGNYYNVGYAVYDSYDLGEFEQEINQTESKRTPRVKYGTKRELIKAIDALHSKGIKVIADIVMNHKLGSEVATLMNIAEREPAGSMDPINAYLTFNFNRSIDTDPRKTIYSNFVWEPKHFDGIENYGVYYLFQSKTPDNVNQLDNGGGPESHLRSDIILGADIDFENSETKTEMISWSKWLIDNLNLDGFRVDAIRHIDNDFIRQWTEEMNSYFTNKGKDYIIFGENWDGWSKRLNAYSYNPPTNPDRIFNESSPDTYKGIGYGAGNSNNSKVMQLFDVPLHYTFYKIANGQLNMEALLDVNLLNNSLVKYKPTKTITFVDNHDTVPAQALQSYVPSNFKLQAYAFILLYNGGIPCVYYEDMYKGNAKYTTDEQGKTWNDSQKYDKTTELYQGIKELIWVRHNYAYGEGRNPTTQQSSAYKFYSYTRDGKNGKDLVVIIAKPGETSQDNGDSNRAWIDPYNAGPSKTFNLIAGDGNGVTQVTTDGFGWGGFTVGPKGYSVWLEQ